MEEAEHNSLIKSFRAAVQAPGNPVRIKMKVADQVVFEIEIEDSGHAQLNSQVSQIIERAVAQAAAAVLVQNEIKKNKALPA